MNTNEQKFAFGAVKEALATNQQRNKDKEKELKSIKIKIFGLEDNEQFVKANPRALKCEKLTEKMFSTKGTAIEKMLLRNRRGKKSNNLSSQQ